MYSEKIIRRKFIVSYTVCGKDGTFSNGTPVEISHKIDESDILMKLKIAMKKFGYHEEDVKEILSFHVSYS